LVGALTELARPIFEVDDLATAGRRGDLQRPRGHEVEFADAADHLALPRSARCLIARFSTRQGDADQISHPMPPTL
jgi:hypothetical protein